MNYGNNPLQKNQVLTTLLHQCQYKQIQQVNNCCYQVFNAFPELQPQLFTQKIGNTTNNVIELVGNVPVMYQNTTYSLLTHIIFPVPFPACPPVLRIKNVNSEKYCVSPKYLPNYTPDGFVTLYLSESQSWNSHNNIMRLLQQMQGELSKDFPFFESKQPFITAATNNNQGAFGQSPQNQGFNANNNQGFPQQQQGMYNMNQQQGYNMMGNPAAQQKFNSGYGMQQQQQFNPGYGMNQGPNINYELQVTNRLKQEAEPILKSLLEEFAEEKKIADQVYNMKQVIGESEAAANQIEEELLLQVEAITQQIQSINKFIQENDSVSVNKDNVSDFVVEANPLQTQIMYLVADKDALKETFAYAEGSFKEKRIDFEQLLRATQNLSEQEFDNKLLLKKCIAAVQK